MASVSLTINKFLKFNYNNLTKSDSDFDLNERYKILFDLARTNNFNSFENFLSELKQNANLESDFNKLGINIEKDISNIISGVNILRLSKIQLS